MSRNIQNSLVILAALGAALAVVQTQTNWLKTSSGDTVERERCFGVTKVGENDCATPKHSCASQSTEVRSEEEWIMLPKGICSKLAGGRSGAS